MIMIFIFICFNDMPSVWNVLLHVHVFTSVSSIVIVIAFSIDFVFLYSAEIRFSETLSNYISDATGYNVDSKNSIYS